MAWWDDKIYHLERKVKGLQYQISKLEERLLLSESQNYCKICGNTLDGYVPKGEQP